MQASAELRPVTASPRGALLLAALLLAAAAVTWSIAGSQSSAAPTWLWPNADRFFAMDGYRVGPETLESANGNTYITRAVQPADGGPAMTVILTTSENVKTVYRAGADVPFLGNGYEGVPLSPEALAEAHSRSLSLMRRGDDGWLQVYAYGERRGLLGNGIAGWGLAVFDTVLGRTNDYYLLRVMTPTLEGTPDAVRRVSQLADVLFPRVANWYASVS